MGDDINDLENYTVKINKMHFYKLIYIYINFN